LGARSFARERNLGRGTFALGGGRGLGGGGEVITGGDGCGGSAASAEEGTITRAGGGGSAAEAMFRYPIGSFSADLSIISPPAKPAPRMIKVVPTPAKKMPAFDAMTASPLIETNAGISKYVPVWEKLVTAFLPQGSSHLLRTGYTATWLRLAI